MSNNVTKKTSKKKQEKNRKKIFILILMILFTGVVLTSSTYAWFTANKTITIEKIDVNVAASHGLQVSVDAINWKTVISNADINGAGTTYQAAVNQLPTYNPDGGTTNSIVPVSTIGDIDATTGFMKMFEGEITSNAGGQYILTAEQSIEQHRSNGGSFIAFDIFLQTNQAEEIYLTSNSSIIALGDSTGIENASRVAFINHGTVDAGSAASAAQALKGGTDPIIWEPNYDIHTAAAVKNASDTYGINTTQTGGSVLAYNGVKADITATANVLLNSTDTNFFGPVTPEITTPATGISQDAYKKVFDIQAGITKVRIYMWVEGQDVDCENNASGGSISYNLQFSTLSSVTDTD